MKKAVTLAVLVMCVPGIVFPQNHVQAQNVQEYTDSVVEFVKHNEEWAAPVVALLGFGESFAFLSLLLPATVILVGISGIMGGAGVSDSTILGVWLSAGLAAAFGYGLSYWIGRYFKDSVHTIWPFRNKPNLLLSGRQFFERWGMAGVFFGHFFGPVRAVVPVMAGVMGMKHIPFQLTNIASSMIWSAGILVLPLYGVKTFLG